MKNKKLEKRLDLLENIDWSYDVDVEEKEEVQVTLSKPSPAGEDFSFTVFFDGSIENLDGFLAKVEEYYNDFDPNEHALMWSNAETTGVPLLKELVKDADDIDTMLKELVEFIENDFKTNSKQYTFDTVNGIQFYIEQNFELCPIERKLVNSILCYGANYIKKDKQFEFFAKMLDGIGIPEANIRKFQLNG